MTHLRPTEWFNHTTTAIKCLALLCALALGAQTASAKEPAKAAKAPAKAAKAPAKAAPPKRAAPAKAATKAPSVRDAASNAFKAVNLNAKKEKAGWDRPYLLMAYAAVWLILMFYIIGLARRLRETDKDLQRMQRRLDAHEQDD